MNRTLTRLALCMLFLVALLVSGLPPSHAQDEPVLGTFTVTVPTANVRAGASTTYAILRVVQNSDRFDVLDQAQAGRFVWYKLALPDNASGWMRGDLGVYHEAPPVEETAEATSRPDELTDQERSERNEVLSMYPGGDESQFLDFIRENGWRAEWDKERKAFEVNTKSGTYYFYPGLGIEGSKDSEERAKEDLLDGLTVHGGSIESSDFAAGNAGLRINVYFSDNYERKGEKVGLRFRDDLASSQNNIDILASLIIREFPELQGKELFILLAADNFDIYGTEPTIVKQVLDRVGGYQVSFPGGDGKAGAMSIGENTIFIKVSVNADKKFYEDPDALGNSVYTMALTPFATSGALNAADLNGMGARIRRIAEPYYRITGLPSYTLVGTER